MPRRKQKLTPPGKQKAQPSVKPEVNQRPHEEFARDFMDEPISDADLNFAKYAEDALALESELELEMEEELKAAAKGDTWSNQILRHSWGASPFEPTENNVGRFRITRETFEAMNLQNPFEAMHASHAIVLHMHFLRAMRRASMTQDASIVETYSNLGLKLSAAHTKTQESFARIRNKGQQKIIVERVFVDDGNQRSHGQKVTVSGKNFDERLISAEAASILPESAVRRSEAIFVKPSKNRDGNK